MDQVAPCSAIGDGPSPEPGVVSPDEATRGTGGPRVSRTVNDRANPVAILIQGVMPASK